MATTTHNKTKRTYLLGLCLIAICLLTGMAATAQTTPTQPGAPLALPGEKPQDSVAFQQSNTDEWHNDNNIKVRYKYLNSDKIYEPDSSIHIFHRKAFSQPWNIDLGNFGTASRSLMFKPEDRFGPTLGYNVLDVYRLKPDSLKYYNTTAPYAEFCFSLGSKLEQNLHILHTQNIKPNWNFAFEYNRLSSTGFFLLQRTAHDMGSFSTNYESINRRYKLKAGFTYNKNQQDENGGIADETQLVNPDFDERSNVDINYANAVSGSNSSVPRSLVTNVMRDYNVLVQQSYSWGRTDSLYNDDSTKISIEFTPRFGVTHQVRLSNQQYSYKDKAPDSLRYAPFFAQKFVGDGSDSVFTRQKQNTFDNALLLNGYIGKKEKQLQFNAGAGIRVDKFSTRFLVAAEFITVTSNYVTGQIRKEALKPGQWFYNIDAKFYVTGAAAGNSMLHASAGKELGDGIAILEAGVQQNINNAAYNFTTYINQYDTISNSFNKESVTTLYATAHSVKYNFNVGMRSYLISNYLYMNQAQLPDQYAAAFNLLQASAQKAFKWRGIVLDNEIVYQQVPSGAPVNVPLFMGRHQLSYERKIFKSALQIATGIELRYYSPYNTAAYSPIFHRYYYNTNYFLVNDPAYSFFFNFKVKRFRSFIMLDHLQLLFKEGNFINAPGYPAQNMMIRFGFNWVLLK